MVFSNRRFLFILTVTGIFTLISPTSFSYDFSLNKINLANIDKKNWRCQYCPPSGQRENKLNIMLNHQNRSDGTFSTLTGDKTKGLSSSLSGQTSVQNNENRLDVKANNLGQDNLTASLTAHLANNHLLGLSYRQLSIFSYDSAFSPFVSSNSANLQLPGDWQQQNSTTNMPVDTFAQYSLSQQRKSWRFNAQTKITNAWKTYLEFNDETKKGLSTTQGSLLTQTVVLPKTIDQQHKDFEIGSYFTHRNSRLLINYLHSQFANNQSVILWQNPFSPAFGNASFGQSSVAPDNTLNQLSLLGNYNQARLRLQAKLSYGELKQTQQFLPYTINPNLVFMALPNDNLDGKVRRKSGYLNALYKLSRHSRFNLSYRFNERENDTPIAAYQRAITDSALLNQINYNKPYSYESEQLKARWRWRITGVTHFSAGHQIKKKERSFQQRKHTKNRQSWLKLTTASSMLHDISLKLSRDSRQGSEFLNHTPNLIQHYHLADRTIEQIKLRGSIIPIAKSELSLAGYYSRSQFEHSDTVPKDDKRRGVDLSFNVQVSERVSANINLHKQWQEQLSQNEVHQTFDHWLVLNSDTTDTASIGIDLKEFADGKLAVNAEYTYSYSKGALNIPSQLVWSEEYNRLLSNNQSIAIKGQYSYSTDISLQARLLYQRFDEKDQFFEFSPNHISNLLSHGLANYNYDALRISAGLSYKF